jgi:hypothetical protein
MPLAVQFRGSGTASVADWLSGRAATLVWLSTRRYPAPRVVTTRTGDPVGVAGPWLTWATTDVTGPARRGGQPGTLGGLGPLGAPDQLGQPGQPGQIGALGQAGALGQVGALGRLGLLGAALGRLHALDAAAAPGSIGLASWYPATAIPAALGRLRAVEPLLPGEWRPLHGAFVRTLLAVQRAAAELPQAVVHGDPWPGNLVPTAEGRATLIGWEYSGLGLPILDLGYCLLECHVGGAGVDSGQEPGRGRPWEPGREWGWEPGHLSPGPPGPPGGPERIQPDERRIGAVLAGYSRWRQLHDSERQILPEAIRFAPAYIGAIHFEQALLDGVRGAPMDARLGRIHNRLAVSQAVTDLAVRHLRPPDAPEPVR